MSRSIDNTVEYSAEQHAQREELSRLLALAARLEQSLMCQYLFAAYSFKRTHDEGGVTYRQLEMMRRWQSRLLPVARQEMEHLGLVMNLGTAIGDLPEFALPSFPFTDQFEDIVLEHRLEPFTIETLTRFVEYEMPEELDESNEDYRFLQQRIPGFNPNGYDAIARLYQRIHDIIETLPESLLLIGPPDAQISTHDVFPGAIVGLDISRHPAYGLMMHKITDKKSALAVVEQIAAEGEGAKHKGGKTADGKDSHFATMMDILREFVQARDDDPNFTPSRPVVSNPTLSDTPADGTTRIEDEFSRDALALFEASYTTLLKALSRFFSFPQHDPQEMAALQQAAFYPMMTTIIRPLCEMLTLLPADGTGGQTAGASFHTQDAVPLAPHKWSVYRTLDRHYGEMELLASKLINALDTRSDLPPQLHERMQLLSEQISRSRMILGEDYKKADREI